MVGPEPCGALGAARVCPEPNKSLQVFWVRAKPEGKRRPGAQGESLFLSAQVRGDVASAPAVRVGTVWAR